MPIRQLASDEPILADALLLIAIGGGVIELLCSTWMIIELFRLN